ncbi:rhodanese-like domain-containing protein [Skermanella mucosa]|uniref:rhodanese-like domain-containing protein n=1 Tax=Skermanella mucosa TaxID=1789672 RepID=UPI00192BD747|nr:rhodanese-like domain-containing protein [Skermanella mucosa]UEM23566.1 rhodanese-like domain-containing protein [Skermanella mucosa]
MSEDIPNVQPKDVWEALKTDPSAKLVDVRTTPEWSFVGQPDMSSIGKAPVRIQWQVYPGMEVEADFIHKLRVEGVEPEDKVYFLCRSGVRSTAAAKLAAQHGYTQVFNIEDGFEGPKDEQGHRGTVAGWKRSGLPWSQG